MAEVMDSAESKQPQGSTTAPQWFGTTHWSVVMVAGRADSAQAGPALEKLCRTYWPPIYSYLRRQGFTPADAQDLTQGFFLRLLKLDSFADVSSEKGRFRTFLLAALKHFLSDERDRVLAEKRGGRNRIISLDEDEAEQGYLRAPSLDLPPEAIFDRRWALTVLEGALARLRQDHASPGKAEIFAQLGKFLSSQGTKADYEALAPKLGMSAGAVAVAVHRLRQRYRECIRLELAQTVTSLEDLDQELKYLFAVLSAPEPLTKAEKP
jgi:RNA polymerase sigma-70 factor (ECF subfamily)